MLECGNKIRLNISALNFFHTRLLALKSPKKWIRCLCGIRFAGVVAKKSLSMETSIPSTHRTSALCIFQSMQALFAPQLLTMAVHFGTTCISQCNIQWYLSFIYSHMWKDCFGITKNFGHSSNIYLLFRQQRGTFWPVNIHKWLQSLRHIYYWFCIGTSYESYKGRNQCSVISKAKLYGYSS